MKKIFRTMMAFAIAAITLTACEDVPAPYPMPDSNGQQGPENDAEAKGSGTLEDPFNAVGVINYIKSLGAGVESDRDVYVKGIVSSIKEEYTTNFGNGTFYISEDGTSTNQFYVYRALYLGNKKFTSKDEQIKVGDEVIICGRVTMYNNTPETAQNKAFLYSLNGKSAGGGGGNTGTGTPSGTGVQSDPYNVAGVLKYIETLGADVTSDKEVYIKGKITDISEEFSTQYGNATFTMGDEGVGNEFTAYRIKYLGNEKYKSGQTQIKVGDEVIVCGKVVNFKGNTPETAQNSAYLYSLNGTTGGGDTPGPQPGGDAKGTGTQADPYNVAAVLDYIGTLGADVTSSNEVYVKGKVSSITEAFGTQYGNATFTIQDDGVGNEFLCYRIKYLGNEKYQAGWTQIKVNDEVIVCGKVVNFRGNTPETAQNTAYLYSLNGSTEATPGEGGDGGGEQQGGQGGGEETTDGFVITMADFGLANQADATTLTASDGTTLTFAQEGGRNAPKYYTAAGGSVRMYAQNSLTISAKKAITKVVITTTEPYQGTAYNGNDALYGEAGGSRVTVKRNGDTEVSFSDFSSQTLKIVNDFDNNSGGTQLRVMKITIVYAE